MKLIITVLLLVFSVAAENYPVADKYKACREVSHVIDQYTVLDSSHCSSVAVGPHALLTAAHCEKPESMINVDGKQADIVEILRDGSDHSILLLDKIKFDKWVPVVQRKLEVGEDVVMFGSPGKFSELLRHGYLAGWVVEENKRPEMVLDMNGFFGDSGAPMFDSTGALIGIVNTRWTDKTGDGDVFNMMGSWQLSFTDDQLKKAQAFK